MWILGILLIVGLGLGIYFSDVSLQKGRVPKFSALKKLPPSALIPLPDLKIDSFIFSPQIIYTGESAIFTVNIKNQGNATAANAVIKLKVDNVEKLGGDSTPTLEAGAADPAYLEWLVTEAAGSHAINICVDTTNAVAESNENNNCINGTINVMEGAVFTAGPLPDLRVSSITPSYVQSDGKVGLQSITVSSSGLSDSSVTAHVIAYPTNDSGTIYSALVKGQDITLSGSNPTTITNIKWTLDELKSINATRFAARVDDLNAIAESNEDNNFLEISIPKRPDWIVQQVGVSNVQPSSGQNVDITATVKNQNENGSSSSPIAVQLYIDNVPVEPANNYFSEGHPTVGFPGGATVTASFIWTAGIEGSHTTKICVNQVGPLDIQVGGNKFISESNANNNCAPGPTINAMAGGQMQ